MIKVSILIAVYNQEDLIRRCLDSIPDRDDVEVIVVDDCSTDNTYQIIEDNYPNVILLKNEKNLGIGLTRNALLDAAKGQYIFFLDSDDYLYTDIFNDVIDKELKDQVILVPRCRRNDNITFHPGVHRGDFVKRSFIGNVRFKDMRQREDAVFRDDLKALPSYNLQKIEYVVYHYNEPRIGSLTWEDRKRRGIPGYEAGIEEWEKAHGH